MRVYRLLRGESLRPALSGLPGVVVACGIAAWTGSANGFFLIGIWAALLGAVVALVSILVRRPLTGVIRRCRHEAGLTGPHDTSFNGWTLAAHRS